MLHYSIVFHVCNESQLKQNFQPDLDGRLVCPIDFPEWLVILQNPKKEASLADPLDAKKYDREIGSRLVLVEKNGRAEPLVLDAKEDSCIVETDKVGICCFSSLDRVI